MANADLQHPQMLFLDKQVTTVLSVKGSITAATY